MTRVMFDSVNAAAIPTTAQMVAGYVDGGFRWSAADWARFPNAIKVRIAVASYVPGTHVYDCETGDFSPDQVADVVAIARDHGENPTVYMNASTWPAVRDAFARRYMSQPPYWVASYPGGGAVIPPGAIAHQYANSAMTGSDFDLSVVADFWPGVDSAAGAASDTMPVVTDAQFYRLLSAVYGVMLGPDGTVQKDAAGVPIPTPAMATTLAALKGVGPGDVSAFKAELDHIASVVDRDLAH